MRKFTLFLAFLFFIGVNFAFAQTRTISGTVTSADNGSALPGVSVVVVGTTNGTVTDLNGKYTLTVGPNAKALSFSFVGMKKQEITIGSSNEINVVMQTQAYAVNEVVVTALGVSRQARALGYSVSSVNSTEISKTAVPTL
ncbi:MAG: carboxypeptidase-like regulatory domain-containing protein [Bacteroidales bacterium]|nr:carboxypeptidase-like regulatory domain-containing protein [Bacteroidales bacterium]